MGCFLVVLAGVSMQAQDVATPSPKETRFQMVSFFLKPKGASEFAWSITSFGDGSGVYRNHPGALWIETPIKLNEADLQIFANGKVGVERRNCETKAKNIARTGQKTLTYGLGPSALDCTFNYSDDANINAVSGSFQAIAETMQFGERLMHEKRFDKLGLDAELEALAGMVKDGRAIEVENIAAVLQSLVEDESLMERVRRRAGRLLEGMGVAAEK